jgi:hypothetical protein
VSATNYNTSNGYRKCFVITTQLVSLAKRGLALVSGIFKEESLKVVLITFIHKNIEISAFLGLMESITTKKQLGESNDYICLKIN